METSTKVIIGSIATLGIGGTIVYLILKHKAVSSNIVAANSPMINRAPVAQVDNSTAVPPSIMAIDDGVPVAAVVTPPARKPYVSSPAIWGTKNTVNVGEGNINNTLVALAGGSTNKRSTRFTENTGNPGTDVSQHVSFSGDESLWQHFR